MIAVFIAPFYIILNIYLIVRILRWFRTWKHVGTSRIFQTVFVILYAAAALSPLGAAFAGGKFQQFWRIVNNHWLGTLLYFVLFLLLLDIIHILYSLITQKKLWNRRSEQAVRTSGILVLIGTLVVSGYGTIHALQIKTTGYETVIRKDSDLESLRVMLVADLHLGANVGMTQISQMKEIVDTVQPDLIVYAGDIFDNDYDAITDPEEICATLASMKTTYGSYACWGNHDIDETIFAGFTFDTGESSVSSDPRMDQFLADAGITLLADESILVDDQFYVCGRIDASSDDKSGIIRDTPEELLSALDHTKPILVIDHQPKELDELAAAGADLVLSGHTHNGQTFPGNLTIGIQWENPTGMITKGNMTDIVTSGLGIWGPALRVGTDSEVCIVDVTFAE